MVKRFVIIFFLITQSVQAECKYYAEADVENGKLINRKNTTLVKKRIISLFNL